MNAPSIRRGLLIRCGIGVGVLLCMLSASTYLMVRHGLYKELDKSIAQTASLLSNQVELENGRITFEWQEGLGTNHALIEDGLFQYWEENTGKTTRSPGLQVRDLPKFCGPDGAPQLMDIQLPDRRRHARAIGMRVYPFVLPAEMERMKEQGRILDPKTFPHVLVVARDTKPVHHVLTRLRWILGTGTLLTLGIGFALIERAVHVSLRPINLLTQQVRDRTGRQLDSALDLPGELPSELAGLAKNFDLLLARVAETRRRERDFIRHAAHELRTPIAGLQAATDLALSKPRESAAYVGHLESCRKTARELGELVKRLTALARIDQTPVSASLEAIDLASVLMDCLQRFLPVFEQRGLKIPAISGQAPLWAIGDRALVRIVFNNLLDNAASHAEPGSEVAIRFLRSGDKAEVSVSNSAKDMGGDLERLFEPLFRRESSRHDAESHLGIGLTLSLDAAHAMAGSLTAGMTEDGWIEFALGLPLAAES